MIIRPADGETLWDSWMLEADGLFHLFYLASNRSEGRIGHAVGSDLLTWERRPDLVLPFHPYTGMVVADGKRFILAIGEMLDAVQTTVFYESTDLEHWRPLRGAARLRPAGPWYLERPDQWRPLVPWRDPFLYHSDEDGCWHAIVYAGRPEFGPDDTGATLAHARTRDFTSWQLLPPLDTPSNRFYHLEVPELVSIEGSHYLLFSTGSAYGIRWDTPGRRESVGTYYFKANSMEGPYELPADPLLVGAGLGRMGPYVARTIKVGRHWMLYHHNRWHQDAWEGAWGFPKQLRQDHQRDLRAEFWPALYALTRPAAIYYPPVGGHPWRSTAGGAAAQAQSMGTSFRLAGEESDLILACRLCSASAQRCSVALRTSASKGVLVTLDFAAGTLEIALSHRHPIAGWGRDRTGFVPDSRARGDPHTLDRCEVALTFSVPHQLTVVARHECIEVYLENQWKLTTMLPTPMVSTGGIELVLERGAAEFSDISLHRFEPLKPSERSGERRLDPFPG